MQQTENDISFKDIFLPLTTIKAIWILIVSGFIVFFNMLFNNFVWDDVSYILRNPEVYHINLPLFFQQNMFNNQGQYRPLAEFYFSILYSLFSTNAFFYHIIQLSLHIATAVLVFLFFKKFFNNFLSFLLAFIFLVHPMQVESVSYIGTTTDIFFLLFGFPVLFLLDKKNEKNFFWIIVFFLFLISFFIKEAALQMVMICVFYAALFNRKHVIKISFIGGVSIVLYLIVRFSVAHVYFDTRLLVPIARLSFTQRIFNIPGVLFYYIKTFVFPWHLTINQQWYITSPDFINFFLPLSILCIIFFPIILYTIFLIVHKRNEGLVFLFFLFWTIIGFGMYSQLIPLDRTVADWWMYFPMVGLLGLVGSICSYIPLIKNNGRIVYTILIIGICLFSLRTIIRNTNWFDNVTLFSHDSKYYTNYIIENDYGAVLTDAHEYTEALIHAKKSVALFSYEFNTLNVGRIYELSGHLKEAEKYYTLAVNTNWKYAASYPNNHIIYSYTHLTKLLLMRNDPKDALTVISRGLEDYKNDKNYSQSSDLLYLLVIADYQLGNYNSAVDIAKKIYTLSPNSAMTKKIYFDLSGSKKVDSQVYFSALAI